MINRLSILNGLAILAVVVSHSCAYGQIAMFLWAHRYLSVTSPYWDQIGSIPYYFLMTIRQLATFSVPAFLFISGFFVAYAAKGSKNTISWQVIKSRIYYLLIPYTIWSFVVFALSFLNGEIYSPLDYVTKFLFRGATEGYYFIPLLCYLYLLSPLMIRIAKSNWRTLIIICSLLQLLTIALHYIGLFFNVQTLQQIEKITGWLFIRWVLFFAVGLVVGLRLQPFKDWLFKNRNILVVLLVLFALFTIFESDILLRATLRYWGAFIESLSYSLYTLTFIFCFLAFDKFSIPFSSTIFKLGKKSYGIYLIHYLAISYFAKLIYHLFPQLLAYPILLLPFFIAVGLGFPLVLMKIINISPARKTYRFVFG